MLMKHQPILVLQHFIILCSSGLSQFCNVYKTSACTGSAVFIKHWPGLVLQHFIFFWLLRPVPSLQCYQTSACPSFAALDMFQACTSSAAFIDYQHVPLLQYWCSSGLYWFCVLTKHQPAQFCIRWLALASPTFTGKCTNPMTHFCVGLWLNHLAFCQEHIQGKCNLQLESGYLESAAYVCAHVGGFPSRGAQISGA